MTAEQLKDLDLIEELLTVSQFSLHPTSLISQDDNKELHLYSTQYWSQFI